LTKTFVTEKEERLILAVVTKNRTTFAKVRDFYWTTNIEAKLITVERRRLCCALKEVPRV